MRAPMAPWGIWEKAERRGCPGTLAPPVGVGTRGCSDSRALKEKRVPPHHTFHSEEHEWAEKSHIDRIENSINNMKSEYVYKTVR